MRQIKFNTQKVYLWIKKNKKHLNVHAAREQYMSGIIKAEYKLIRLLNFKRWIVFAHLKKQVIYTVSQFYTRQH